MVRKEKISPFPTMISKKILPESCLKLGLYGKESKGVFNIYSVISWGSVYLSMLPAISVTSSSHNILSKQVAGFQNKQSKVELSLNAT